MTTSDSLSTVEHAAPSDACPTAGPCHRQERNAALFDECADLVVGLVSGAFAENDQRTPGALQNVERALQEGTGISAPSLRSSPSASSRRPHRSPDEKLGRQIEIDAARTRRRRRGSPPRRCRCRRRAGCGTRPCRSWRWPTGPSLRSRPAASRRPRARTSRDQDHRKAVGRRIGQCRQPVEKAPAPTARERHQFVRKPAMLGRGVAGVLFMAERDDAECACAWAMQPKS